MNHKRVPPPTPIYYHEFLFSEDECCELVEELRVLRVRDNLNTTLSRFYMRLGSRNV